MAVAVTPSARLAIAVTAIGAGTYAFRAVFLLFASRLTQVPDAVREALRMIPPAVFAALVLPALARTGGEIDVLGARPLAGLLAALVGWRTGNVLLTVAVGLIAVAVLQQVPALR